MRVVYDYIFHLEYDKEKYKEMLLDAAETVLGIFGFERTLYGKPKGKKWWMELRRNRMIDLNAETNNQYNMASNKSEIVAYHNVKRKFLDLLEMQNEDPDQLEICEFKGEDFDLVAN